jgi:signal transduction histidine kinase
LDGDEAVKAGSRWGGRRRTVPYALVLPPIVVLFVAEMAALALLPLHWQQRVVLGLSATLIVFGSVLYLGTRHGHEAFDRSWRMYTLTSRLARSRRDLTGSYNRDRHRLRRDLHDSLGPVLATAVMRIDSVRGLIETDPGAVESALVELREDTRAALAEIRRLIYELRPPPVEPSGLRAAVRTLADEFNRASDGRLVVTVSGTGELADVSPEVGLAVYRILSEALTNVARHSGATRCEIVISIDDELVVEVTDNGRGLRASSRRGLGLHSMRERAQELGGDCRVESLRPQGTLVRVRIPLYKGKEGREWTC